MRIAIDLQACQASNKKQGIGRFSLEFARALIRNAGSREIVVALNAAFPVEADRLRELLSGELRPDQIVTWKTQSPADYASAGNSVGYLNSIRTRNQFFASLGVDIVYTPSLFEGFADAAVTGIAERHGRSHVECATLYDLIPLIHESIYLADASMRAWYMGKLEDLKRADLLLAISDSSRREGLEHLGLPVESISTAYCGVSPAFQPRGLSAEEAAVIKGSFGIRGGFVMYSGGIDVRKNVERLIQAYAALPSELREDRQLAIVCRVSDEDRARFAGIGRRQGLADRDLVFTGYVSDDDLIALYSICDVFAFPSWHEGFGLPVVEAMACGAPVVTSDRSSLPEVVGRSDNLFDPYSVESIAAALARVLGDRAFAKELSEFGLRRSRQFSWDEAAKAALAAFDEAIARAPDRGAEAARPTLAYVSPLPPEQSGISDYSAELLPSLSEHYRITVVTPAAGKVAARTLGRGVQVKSVEWFERHADAFDRVVYQFGNSSYHGHMFELLSRYPGTVVLHDFFLSGIVAHLDFTGELPGVWSEYLYRSHGYRALVDMEQAGHSADPIWRYPGNLPVLQQAVGTIVHSQFARDLARHWYGENVAQTFKQVPQLREAIEQVGPTARKAVRDELCIPENVLLVCSFGMVGQNKLNEELLAAWRSSGLADREDAYLVLVGEVPDNEYGRAVSAMVAQLPRVSVTGFVSTCQYNQYLAAADAAVQLRSRTRGETSRAALDCLAAGLPLLVNANGSMAELPEGLALVVPDAFTDEQLAAGLVQLLEPELRSAMSMDQRQYVESALNPGRIAALYRDAIEAFYSSPVAKSMSALASELAAAPDRGGRQEDLDRLTAAVSYNNPTAMGRQQLLVDVSELVGTDARSGIQRVVHGVLSELLALDDLPYRVEPVYTPGDGHYYYARAFTADYLGLSTRLADEVIDFAKGDVFLGLDLAPVALVTAEAFLQEMRQAGVMVIAVVYDVLPLQRPDCFPPEAGPIFRPWVSSIGRCATGLACISRTVAGDVHDAMDSLKPDRVADLPIWSFPMGLSLQENHSEEQGDDVAVALSCLTSAPIIMMVGTLEPRKGYAQALAAFNKLWADNHMVQLVIVGKQGWMVEDLARSIENHPQFGRRLHWFKGACDNVLNALYSRASALLCASEGEGYGLPLLEAFARGLPVIARDIPVFREVGGNRLTYFSGFDGEDLASPIAASFSGGESKVRTDDGWRPGAGWRGSVEALKDIFTGKAEPLFKWRPGSRTVLWATDARIRSDVGRVQHGRIESTGTTGYLVDGPGLQLLAGTYELALDLEVRHLGDDAGLEVVSQGGRCILLRARLRSALEDPDALKIVLEAKHDDLRVKIRVNADDRVALRKLVLTRVDSM